MQKISIFKFILKLLIQYCECFKFVHSRYIEIQVRTCNILLYLERLSCNVCGMN